MKELYTVLAAALTYILLYIAYRKLKDGKKKAKPEKKATPEMKPAGASLNEILGYDFIQVKQIDRNPERNQEAEHEREPGEPINYGDDDNILQTTGTSARPDDEREGTIQIMSDKEREEKKKAAAAEPEVNETEEIPVDELQMMAAKYFETLHEQGITDGAILLDENCPKNEEEMLKDYSEKEKRDMLALRDNILDQTALEMQNLNSNR